MTEMFGEAWPPMSVPDLAPDDDDDDASTFRTIQRCCEHLHIVEHYEKHPGSLSNTDRKLVTV